MRVPSLWLALMVPGLVSQADVLSILWSSINTSSVTEIDKNSRMKKHW